MVRVLGLKLGKGYSWGFRISFRRGFRVRRGLWIGLYS